MMNETNASTASALEGLDGDERTPERVEHSASTDPRRLLRECATVVDVLRRRAAEDGERTSHVFLKDGEVEDGRFSYAELDRRARAIAVWLRSRAGAGERALLLYPPGLDFLAGFFGCLYAGVVAVPLYPPRPNRRDARIVDISIDADARFLLATSAVTSSLSRSLSHSPELANLLVGATDEALDADAEEWKRDWPAASGELAYLQYTSGSTRSPKGAMVSHENLLANVLDIELTVRHPPGSVFVSWLPHFHDMGLVYGLLAPLCLGFPCYFMPPASFLQHPARWLSAISRYRGTHSGAPNFAFDLCAERVTAEQKAKLDLRCWEMAFNGAEPVRARTLDAFAQAFEGCGLLKRALSPSYGLAEATLKVSTSPPTREPLRLRTRGDELARGRVALVDEKAPEGKTLVGCGVPEGTEVLIVNPGTLVPCGPDEVGEIWLRGPSVALGYFRRPEETASTFRAMPAGGDERYLRTGDLGFLFRDELFVTGRSKDLIIVRGRNHYPQDIELTVASAHPALRPQGAAFSVDVSDEERLVVVQEVDRHYRSPDVDEIAAAVRRAIAEEHELNLHALVLVKQSGVPKTSSGKVQRRACARAFEAGSLPVVAEWRETRTGTPASAETDPHERAGGAATAEDIESFVSKRLSSHLGVPASEVDLEQPFSALGMDSARALTLLGELETWLGRRLSPTLFWNYPTIAALAEHLGDASGERNVATWNP